MSAIQDLAISVSLIPTQLLAILHHFMLEDIAQEHDLKSEEVALQYLMSENEKSCPCRCHQNKEQNDPSDEKQY
jgi:hypothetical protein